MQELSAWPAWANLVETLRRLAWKYKGRGSKGKNNGGGILSSFKID